MSSYRKMRRRARQIRRSGMQPMMVINSGDQPPETMGMALLHLAWRYRSELAPLTVAVAVFGAGWWAHTALGRWWEAILSAVTVAAWALGAFGGKFGIPSLIERLYVAIVTLAAGTWVSLAAAIGSSAAPLPQALLIGGVILSIPWWAHRRRCVRVRVERKLDAWPDIAEAVGLIGSQVMSAAVDVWGWRARLRLGRGQTITDVMAKIPALESALGTVRNAVRVAPTPDDLANRCELRVLDRDPHAEAIPWPGPSVASITDPIDFGPFEDAVPCRVLLLRRHGLVGGSTGTGKSNGLNVLMGNLVACPDVVIWAIDLKRGMELGPWASCIGRLATTPEQATVLLRDAVAILKARAGYLAAEGRRVWEPSAEMPALVILIDEYAELADTAPEALRHADSVARLGRAVAVTLMAATQRPTQKAMGHGAVRSQMDIRLCFRLRERKDTDLVLGQGMLSAGWHPHTLNAPGKFLISAAEYDTPRRARAYLVTDQAVADTAAHYAWHRPGLDEVSRPSIGNNPTPPDDPAAEGPPGLQAPAEDAEDETRHVEYGDGQHAPEAILWAELCTAPNEGCSVPDLMRATGMRRTWVYDRLSEYAQADRVVQVSRGRWRAAIDSQEDRP